MNIKEVIYQLESLRDHSADMAKGADEDEIWHKDVTALDITISFLKKVDEVLT